MRMRAAPPSPNGLKPNHRPKSGAGVVVALESDRTCGDRFSEAASKPHLGQRRGVGVDHELYIEALIGEAQIHGRRLGPRQKATD
jgi:hypothetical protein